MRRWKVPAIGCVALGLLLAGCGGDDDDDGGGAPAATTPETETSPRGGGEVAVRMKDIKFVPRNLTVKAGTKVVWTNDDEVDHTVTKDSGPGGEFDSGNVSSGKTFEQTFTAPGKVDYVCTIHPGQDGTITVE
jgi:plastocyanin